MSASTEPTVDGRTARRDRNREAVLDAAIELFAEGELTPSATDVAARSGVSLRSVYRYYEDLEDLMRASIARAAERNAHLFELDRLGEGSLDDRIERIVAQRRSLYAAIGGMARAAVVRARTNELVRDRVVRQMAWLRDQAVAMFAPELEAMPAKARRETADALAVALGLEAMEQLHIAIGRSDAQAAAVQRRLLRSLLTV
jgi:AcrR family transcriptional regulator